MISIPGRAVKPQVMPFYTGVIFPYGRGGRNVPIYLITSNSLKAQSLGSRLNVWGLPFLPKLVEDPNLKTALVLNPLAHKKFEPMLKSVSFPIVKFGGDPIAMETTDPEEIVAFAKWMTQQFERDKKDQQANKKLSLEDLADAGEIETIN